MEAIGLIFVCLLVALPAAIATVIAALLVSFDGGSQPASLRPPPQPLAAPVHFVARGSSERAPTAGRSEDPPAAA